RGCCRERRDVDAAAVPSGQRRRGASDGHCVLSPSARILLPGDWLAATAHRRQCRGGSLRRVPRAERASLFLFLRTAAALLGTIRLVATRADETALMERRGVGVDRARGARTGRGGSSVERAPWRGRR